MEEVCLGLERGFGGAGRGGGLATSWVHAANGGPAGLLFGSAGYRQSFSETISAGLSGCDALQSRDGAGDGAGDVDGDVSAIHYAACMVAAIEWQEAAGGWRGEAWFRPNGLLGAGTEGWSVGTPFLTWIRRVLLLELSSF